MIHYFFIGLTWALGTFGVVGTIAVMAATVYLGPAAVLGIIERLLAKFIACTKCVVAVVFVLATVGAYWIGHHEAVSVCRAAEENSVQAAKHEDATITQKAATDEINLAEPIEAKSNERHKNDIFENEELKARPGCAFDDIDAGTGDSSGGMLSNLRAAKAKPAARAK